MTTKNRESVETRNASDHAGEFILRVDGVHKTYRLGRVDVPVLRGVSLALSRGEFVAVFGASGSGKSTLLHLIGGLDEPDANGRGRIEFQGEEIGRYGSSAIDRYRRERVGIIFQFYHLLPELNVLQNVIVASMVRHGARGYPGEATTVARRAALLLERVGLSHRLKHRPIELSGGERQRVAIARALINEPTLLLADEPTGNLDRETGARILDLLMDVRKERAQTMIVVTHDPVTAARADRTVKLEDGRISSRIVS